MFPVAPLCRREEVRHLVLDRSIEAGAEIAELARAAWPMEKRLDYWKSEEGCTLISGFVRDGMKPRDIARAIGITPATFVKWMNEYEEINKAVRDGSAIADYQVENALLKSALGYKAKNVTVTTVIRYGKVVETQKVEEEVDVAPNVNAQKIWLYNRKPGNWMPDSKIAGIDDSDDDVLQVEVINAVSADEDEDFDSGEASDRRELIKELKEADPDEVDLDAWPDDWDEEVDDWGDEG